MRVRLFGTPMWAVASKSIVVGLLVCADTPISGSPTVPPQGYDSTALAGRRVPDVPVTTLDGRSIRVEFAGRPTLLYVVAPRNAWCIRNAANIRALWKARQGTYQFVGVSLLPGIEADLQAEPLPFSVHVMNDRRDPKLAPFGFGAAPALYLISSNSVIERAWGGALTGPAQVDAEAFFGIKLPGVSTPFLLRP